MLNAITVTFTTSTVSQYLRYTADKKNSKICHSHEGNDELSILSIICFICDPKQQNMLSAGPQFNKKMDILHQWRHRAENVFFTKNSPTQQKSSVWNRTLFQTPQQGPSWLTWSNCCLLLIQCSEKCCIAWWKSVGHRPLRCNAYYKLCGQNIHTFWRRTV